MHPCVSAVSCGAPTIAPSISTDPSKVVGGQTVVENSWPWQIALIQEGQCQVYFFSESTYQMNFKTEEGNFVTKNSAHT